MLQHLSLGFNKITSLDEILGLKHRANIKSLSLGGNPLEEKHPDWAYQILSHYSNLTVLNDLKVTVFLRHSLQVHK